MAMLLRGDVGEGEAAHAYTPETRNVTKECLSRMMTRNSLDSVFESTFLCLFIGGVYVCMCLCLHLYDCVVVY